MKDHETVSITQYHEVLYVAQKFSIPVWMVYKAIDDLQSNIRSEVYEYIIKQIETPVEPNRPVNLNPGTVEELDKSYFLSEMKNKLNVIQWAEAKNLVKYENRFVQFAKVVEEIGELGKGLIKGDKELEKDSIGDSLVTLIILSAQLGLDIEDCLEHAWQEIKDRTGTTNENGTFIKD